MRTVVGFRPVPVFAQDQTEGDPLPAVCARLHGDDAQGAYAGLVEVAHSFSFTVVDYPFDGETNGDCSHALHRIRIEVTLEPTHRAKTLAHELAHALLHIDRSERALMELEAESVAFVVCDALTIDADEWSFGYAAGWSGGGDNAISAIKAAGTRIQRTADRILSALDVDDDGVPDPTSET